MSAGASEGRAPSLPGLWTAGDLARDLAALGVVAGDTVMVHAGLRALGAMIGGADTLLHALLEAVGPDGTLMAYTDWEAPYEALKDLEGRVPAAHRAGIPAFDPAASRAIRENGFWPELLRTTPGAVRSASPGPSCAALGARAEWLVVDHPLDYGYGPGSPFAKLVEACGKVLMAGAPRDTMTLLHHAEHLADIPGKRVQRYDVPFPDGWRRIEEFDTGNPVVAGLAEDYFATVVTGFLATGHGAVGPLGSGEAVLVPAAEMVAFAVRWLEARVGKA